jgi:methionine aminotransferase
MLHSKLPDIGTTIFTVMSRRARELGAINLGQGFPDYAIDPRLAQLVTQAMSEGYNQYALMEGVPGLREQIAVKINATHGLNFDPATEITITLGATEALFCAIQAIVGPGDEAIVFDPAYDSYDPAIRLVGGRCIHIPLQPPAFRYDWDRVAAAITDRTRLIIINTPHNPACSVATSDDLDRLAALVRERDITVVSDEVYEHVTYDGIAHVSVLAHPELRERSFAVYSFGKALHATGWRVGYCVAPPLLTCELRKVHQFNTFSIAHPLQQAIAQYLVETPQSWQQLAQFFQAKRDRLRSALAGSDWLAPAAQGTYFQLIDYSALSDAGDVEFADRVLTEAGVATIPLSPFYQDPPRLTLLRVCLAKQDPTLDAALARLRNFAKNIRQADN